MPIHCCLVDDHHDVLPFLVACIRAKKIPIIKKKDNSNSIIDENDVIMIHVDSHPDFSLPSKNHINDGYDINEWSNYNNLNSILNNEGGIAEFIIPAIFNNYINKVIWIKPIWSKQFECGYYNFDIGNNVCSNSAAVTLSSSYYIGESIICKKENLVNETITPINFYVSTDDINDNEKNIFCHIKSDHPIPWVLDICLDYFSTCNPFYQEVFNQIKNDDKLNVSIILSDENVITINYNIDNSLVTASTINNIIVILKNFFHTMKNNINFNLHDYADNMKYFNIMKMTMDNIVKDNIDDNNNTLLFDIIHCEYHIHLNNFYEILKLLSNDSKDIIVKVGSLILLPHHISVIPDEVDVILNRLKVFITNCCDRFKSFPLVITIARSSDDDEYTPRHQCNQIQDMVLNLLKEIIPMEIVLHDLCEDSWNTSYSLFLNDKIKQMLKRQKVE